MIENFDDGRSRSFFCRATCLLETKSLESSLNKATRKIKTDKIKKDDTKTKAKILKQNLNEIALKMSLAIHRQVSQVGPDGKGVELVKKKK